MLIVVMYDIETRTKKDMKRLNKIADKCLDRGIRIQNSVYECELNAKQFREFKCELTTMIDPGKDSLRFYNLGNKHIGRIENFGKAASYWEYII